MEEDGGNCVMDTPKGKSNGKLLEVAEGPVVLEAQTCYHCTLPWEERRLVLVAYVVSGLERLAAEHHALVEDLGFQLPTPSHKTGDETYFGGAPSIPLGSEHRLSPAGCIRLPWASYGNMFQIRHACAIHCSSASWNLPLSVPISLEGLEVSGPRRAREAQRQQSARSAVRPALPLEGTVAFGRVA